MTRRGDDDRRLFNHVRDWTLFALGCGIVLAEAVASIGFGRPVDGLVLGAAVSLAGGSLVLQREKD